MDMHHDHGPGDVAHADERLRLSSIAHDSSYSAAARADARAALARLPEPGRDVTADPFVVVTNLPGYLPETDPVTAVGALAALDVIRDACERAWDDEESGDAWEVFRADVDRVDLADLYTLPIGDSLTLGPDPDGAVWEVTHCAPVPDPADVVESAEEAFWTAVAQAYPAARAGDFPPDAAHAITSAMTSAIRAWVAWNVPAGDMHEEG